MSKLRRLRNNILFAMGLLLALDIAFAAYLLWPSREKPEMQNEEESNLRQQLLNKTREVAPLRGMDQKLAKAPAEFKKFYQENIPDQESQISREIQKLARENGVSTQGVRYKLEATPLPGVQRFMIDTGISGDYLRVLHFINALENDRLLFLIQQISLSGEQGGSAVGLKINFVTYVKGTS
jgi:Tfp pilus assembly protein PilO